MTIDDFGIGSGLRHEIEMQELVTADAIVVDVEIDGEAAVGELLESNFDEFFGVDLLVWPPVFEYTSVSNIKIFIFSPVDKMLSMPP